MAAGKDFSSGLYLLLTMMFCGHSSGQDQALDVRPGDVMNMTFDLIDGAVTKILMKRGPRPGNLTDSSIRLLRWKKWHAGSAPKQPEILHPAALRGRVNWTYDQDANTVTIGINNFTVSDTGPGVYYELQQSDEERQKKFYPNVIAPPPSVTSLNVTDVGEDFTNITWLPVEPLDNAPVWYHVEYKAKGDNWHRTARLNGTGGTDPLFARVGALQPAVLYQFRVVASNRFNDSYSPIMEALTKGSAQYFASIITPVILIVVLVAILFYIGYRKIHCQERRNKPDPDNPEAIPLVTTERQQHAPRQQPSDPVTPAVHPEHQPAAPGQDPPAAGQDPPAPEHQPAAPGQNPPAAGQDPPAPGQDPPPPGQDPPAAAQDPPAAGQDPDAAGQEQAVNEQPFALNGCSIIYCSDEDVGGADNERKPGSVNEKPRFANINGRSHGAKDVMDERKNLSDVLAQRHQSLQDYKSHNDNRILEERVSQSGLVFRDPVPEDGNCLFHAISDQLGRVGAQQLSHQALRAIAVKYLRCHPYTLKGEPLSKFVPNEDWDGYLTRMAVDGEWGDHLVVIALANQLQRDIRIISSVNSDEYDVITEPTSDRKDSDAPLLLGHYAELHYVSLDIAPQDFDETEDFSMENFIMNFDWPGQKYKSLLSTPQPGINNSFRSSTSMNMLRGDYNEKNIGNTRQQTTPGTKYNSKAKDGHEYHPNGWRDSKELNMEGEIENMLDGDYTKMNIPSPSEGQSLQSSNHNNIDTDSTRLATEDDFQDIQEHVGLKWKMVARKLGLTEGQIEGIEHDNREETLAEKVYQMLLKWKQQDSKSATVAVLKHALTQAGRGDVALRLKS